MKITIKTLQNKKYELDVELSDTVAVLKRRIETELNLGDASSMRIIKQGKILKDSQTLENANLREKDFLIVMTTKSSSSNSESKSSTVPTTSPSSEQKISQTNIPSTVIPSTVPSSTPQTSQTTVTPATNMSTAPAASAAAAPAIPSYENAASNLVIGQDYEATIAGIMAMGFEHEDVTRAMTASFNNPDRAVEYLFSGIPPSLQGGQASSGGAPPPSSQIPQQGGGMPIPNMGGGGVMPSPPQHAAGGGNHGGPPPPELMNSLQQLAQSNPALLQAILARELQQQGDAGGEGPSTQEQQMMMQLLQNPQFLQQFMSSLGAGGGRGEGPPGSGSVGGGLHPGQVQIQITQEEKTSIDKLQAMGFERDKVIEAFLSCDRNEELAANYLFEHAGDDYDELVANIEHDDNQMEEESEDPPQPPSEQ